MGRSREGRGHLGLPVANAAADGAGVSADARILLISHLPDLKVVGRVFKFCPKDNGTPRL